MGNILSILGKKEEKADQDKSEFQTKYEDLVRTISESFNLDEKEVEDSEALKKHLKNFADRSKYWVSASRAVKNIGALKSEIENINLKDVPRNMFELWYTKTRKAEETKDDENSFEEEFLKLEEKIKSVSDDKDKYVTEVLAQGVIAVKNETFTDLLITEKQYKTSEIIQVIFII